MTGPTAADAWHDPDPANVPRSLNVPSLGRVGVIERLASGKMTTVFRATLNGDEVALKVYKPHYIEKHARRHPTNIAEYEYSRNRAFRASPELAAYVAEPLGYMHTREVSAIVQELLQGEMYYDLCLQRGAPLDEVFAHLEKIVEHAHAAQLFDIDLHAMNVLVVEDNGRELPRLFDFNRIPFHLHPRNPFEALALKLGIIDERTRDRKKLRQFHDFRKLLRRRTPFMTPGS